MGGSGYKKFKKQEKARVKLKGNKTLLPKGQNVTDTNFKVKKIVVKEQLKQHEAGELLTRKHLNMKELIGRLSHHNVSMRQEALSGLKELVSVYGSEMVQANLSSLLRGTMTLTVDKEADVRADTLKLLAAILDKVNEVELAPLFPVVVCHLTCAMTHIEPAVRSDSLRLLDTMLSTVPRLTASHTPTLLPHFLDLISCRGEHARTLSLNLDGKVTSDKWRAKVIGRLNRLFSVILNHCINDCNRSDVKCSVKVRNDKPTYVGLYTPISSRHKTSNNMANLPVQEYTTTLMPLLLDTFTEAVPKQELQDSDAGCVVSSEAAALLQSIVEIILHLWELIKHSSKADSLMKWFVERWGVTVTQRVVRGRFPYSFTAANSRKRQRETDQMMAALQVSRDLEASCMLLNLQLCLLVFLLTPPDDQWSQAVQFIKRSVRGTKHLEGEESAVLCQCLEAYSAHSLADTQTQSQSLLSVMARHGLLDGTDRPVTKRAFDFLTTVALSPSHHLHQDKNFTTWLDSLPTLLCKPTVSLKTVKKIAAIATCNLQAFTNSLDGWIEEILENLPKLKIIADSENEGRWLIVGLFYWVSDWDKELTDIIKQLIQEQVLGSDLTKYLVNILQFKVDSTENDLLKEVLEAYNIN